MLGCPIDLCAACAQITFRWSGIAQTSFCDGITLLVETSPPAPYQVLGGGMSLVQTTITIAIFEGLTLISASHCPQKPDHMHAPH